MIVRNGSFGQEIRGSAEARHHARDIGLHPRSQQTLKDVF